MAKFTAAQLAEMQTVLVTEGRKIDTSKMAPEYQQAFNVGVNFHIAALRAGESRRLVADDVITTASVAMIANLAFAIELYLKSLLKETNRSTKGHDLEVLFNKLLPADRAGLVAAYRELLDQDEEDILNDIRSYASAFAEWRYIFETDLERPIIVYKLAELARACFLYIRSKHPDWAAESVSIALAGPPEKSLTVLASFGGGHMVRFAEE